jgi:hypothetical protein
MVWTGRERRSTIRRESDRSVCPYHDLKFQQVCGNLTSNDQAIDEIKKNMVTKEDLKNMDAKIEKKAPRWVLVTLIVTTVPIFIAMMTWIGSRLDTVTQIKTNQELLMKAFSIDIYPKDHDNKHK